MNTHRELIPVKYTTQISEKPLATKSSEQKSTNKVQILTKNVLRKSNDKTSALKRKSSKVEPITIFDDQPLDLSVKTNKPSG